jgi:hypothetical protein
MIAIFAIVVPSSVNAFTLRAEWNRVPPNDYAEVPEN